MPPDTDKTGERQARRLAARAGQAAVHLARWAATVTVLVRGGGAIVVQLIHEYLTERRG